MFKENDSFAHSIVKIVNLIIIYMCYYIWSLSCQHCDKISPKVTEILSISDKC